MAEPPEKTHQHTARSVDLFCSVFKTQGDTELCLIPGKNTASSIPPQHEKQCGWEGSVSAAFSTGGSLLADPGA